jgi:hypothetical protein
MQPFKVGDKVKCVDPPANVYLKPKLFKDGEYVVANTKVRASTSEAMVLLEGFKDESWFMSSRFVLVGRALPNTVPSATPTSVPSARSDVRDLREERFRAALTTPSDPFVCPKCGAPKAACSYHS